MRDTFGTELLAFAPSGHIVQRYNLETTLIVTSQEISIIGHMTDVTEGMNMIGPQGQAIALKAQGWNSLR